MKFMKFSRYLTVYLTVTSAVLLAVASTPRIPAQVEWENRQLALSVGTPGSWDDGEVWGSTVAEMGDGPCMFYTGLPQSGPFGQIGFATSEDGETWVRGGPVSPVIVAAYAPSVLFDPLSETWTMWYSRVELQTGKYIVERASSPDASCASWTLEGSVLRPEFAFEGNRTDHPTVVFDGSRFLMWYWAGTYSDPASWSIGHATSEDGQIWTKHPSAVIGPRPVDGYSGVCEPHVIYHEDTRSFEMWYTFNRQGLRFAATGYATSLDGLVWCYREDVVFDDELRQQGEANVSYDPVSRQYRMFYEAASDSRWQIFRVTADWTLPRASFTTQTEANTGLFVFDATGSRAPAAPIVRYDWDFGDGTRVFDAGPRPEHRYERPATTT